MEQIPSRPPISTAPLSVILLGADPSQVDVSQERWRLFLEKMQRPFEILLVQPGQSLEQAIRAAHHPLLVICPADLQYQPEDLPAFLAAIDPVDLVMGMRVGRPIPAWRLWLDLLQGIAGRVLLGLPWQRRQAWFGIRGWSHRFIARWIFGLRATDPECPYRLYRRSLFNRIPLQSQHEFVHLEILAKANHLLTLHDEVPVHVQSAEVSSHFFSEAWFLFQHAEFRTTDLASKCPSE